MPVLSFLASGQFWVNLGAVVSALMTLTTAIAFFIGAFGAWFPKLVPVAAWFTRVHDWLAQTHLAGQAMGAKVRRLGARIAGRTASSGYVRMSVLLGLTAFVGPIVVALVLWGCGLGAVAPSALTLEQCEANVVRSFDGSSPGFWSIVEASLEQCGQDAGLVIADVVTALANSKDPALAPYVPEAKATLADPARMQALRMGLKHR